MKTDSYWLASASLPHFGKLDHALDVDVAVIGGGMTGATAAYLLKKAGHRVALLERDCCGNGDTAATTAHLTCVTDARLGQLVKSFGADHARAMWDAGLAAIAQIQANILQEKMDVAFARVPGYLVESLRVDKGKERDALQEESRVARELGFDARCVENVPLFDRPGMEVANQAVFHPLRYLRGLLEALEGAGGHVFDHSEATDFSEKPLSFKANGHLVNCRHIVIATHVPLMGNSGLVSATLFQSKLSSYSSYVVGGRTPKGTIPMASFWDTSDPYYFCAEPHRDFDYVIFGGEDHKTGQVSQTDAIYQRLETLLAKFLPQTKVDHRWSGQVIQTNDGLPMIGEVAENQFAATGFVGNGITLGTLAGMMACDWVSGRKNPWSDLLSVHRKKLTSTWDYIKENMDYPYYMIKDRLRSAEAGGLAGIKPGQAAILKLDGERVAAYRDEKGKLSVVSAACTHMGCLVHWNEAEKTWDCPCHGSRFTPAGKVIAGPAETPLPPHEEK